MIVTRDRAYLQKRLDEAWSRAYDAQRSNAECDATWSRYEAVLSGIENALTALALIN